MERPFFKLPMLLVALLLVGVSPAAAQSIPAPMAFDEDEFSEWEGGRSGWAAWFGFVEYDDPAGEGAVGIGIAAHDGRAMLLRGATFVSSDDQQTWSGVEGSVGLALPTFITPYTSVGFVLAAVDDDTDGHNSITAAEAYLEWGGLVHVGSLWALYGRRNYYGQNGIPRGDRSEIGALGWRFSFD